MERPRVTYEEKDKSSKNYMRYAKNTATDTAYPRDLWRAQ
jgi:hypothetical protein